MRTILAGVILTNLALLSAPTTLWAESTATLSAEEQRWLDRRVSDDERAILDSIVGYAPPEIPADLDWYQGDPTTLQSLRGKVVVLQSWTRSSVVGRAAPTRAAKVLETFSPDDVRILAIHTPEGAEGSQVYLDRREVGVPVVVDETGAYCDELGAFDRPVTLVLDRQGAVRYAGVSITGLPQAVEKLVAEPYDNNAAPPQTVASRDTRDKALGFGATTNTSTPEKKGTGEFPPIAGNVGSAVDLRGRKGPELFAQEWLTGKPDTDGRVIVAEFWATWCGPCVKGIPHLNELQAAFPEEVVVVGISDEPSSKVRPAIDKLRMRYTVATDQSRRMRQMIQNRGIPHAIVMSPDGIVRWQGHPAMLEQETLAQIVRASGGGAGGADGASRYRWTTPAEG